jgi:hypothetical protein
MSQRNPQLAQMAMQEIRNDIFQMRPDEALMFARRLNQDLGGNSPVHEQPTTMRGPNGYPVRGELLTMTDPYSGQEQTVKAIRPEFCNPVAPVGVPMWRQPEGYAPYPGVNLHLNLGGHGGNRVGIGIHFP